MLPTPQELTYFVEIARTGNISRAADRLGVSQPTLSLAIRRLESSLGTPLLVRLKTGVELTKAGQKLVVRAREMVEGWERLRAEARNDDESLSGVYTIGCHPSVGLYALHFLTDLLQKNPGLEIRLEHDLSRKITEAVISFKVDFGIVVNPVAHPDLVLRSLLKDEVSFWTNGMASPQLDPHSNEAVWIYDPELTQVNQLLRKLEKKGIRPKRILTSSNLEVIASMAADGTGIAILPGLVATRVKAYGLKKLANVPAYQDKICLIYRADAQKCPVGRHIARQIEQSFHSKRPGPAIIGRALHLEV